MLCQPSWTLELQSKITVCHCSSRPGLTCCLLVHFKWVCAATIPFFKDTSKCFTFFLLSLMSLSSCPPWLYPLLTIVLLLLPHPGRVKTALLLKTHKPMQNAVAIRTRDCYKAIMEQQLLGREREMLQQRQSNSVQRTGRTHFWWPLRHAAQLCPTRAKIKTWHRLTYLKFTPQIHPPGTCPT